MPESSPKRAQLSQETGRLLLSGVLDHDSVATVYRAGRSWIRQAAGTPLLLDLSRLESTDSSGLALLLDWMRTAGEYSVHLQLSDVPRQLREIARVCDLSDYIDSMIHAS